MVRCFDNAYIHLMTNSIRNNNNKNIKKLIHKIEIMHHDIVGCINT